MDDIEKDKAGALPLASVDDVFVLDGLLRFRNDDRPPIAPANRRLLLRGWAAFPNPERSGSTISFAIDDVAMPVYIRRENRNDVAEHYRIPAMERSGFKAIIDPSGLAAGVRRLSIFVDAIASQTDFRFTVAAPQPPAIPSERNGRARFEIAEFRDRASSTLRSFRLAQGQNGVVRGWVADEASITPPRELYVVVDGVDAFRGRIGVTAPETGPPTSSRDAATFLACFRTADLEVGDHIAELAILAFDGKTLQWSQPLRFTIEPSYTAQTFYDRSVAKPIASVSWIDEPISASLRIAHRRSFARGEIAYVRGWAFETNLRAAANGIFICFENGEQFELEGHALRADVAREYGLPNASYCGFIGSIATKTLPSGTNLGRCYLRSIDGRTVYGTDATVEIDIHD